MYLLDYDKSYKGFVCLSSDGKIYINRHYVFDEHNFPFISSLSNTTSTKSNNTDIPLALYFLPYLTPSLLSSSPRNILDSHFVLNSHNLSDNVSSASSPSNFITFSHQAIPSVSITNLQLVSHPQPISHPMINRPKSGIFKRRVLVADFVKDDHKKVIKALSCPYWKVAMDDEYIQFTHEESDLVFNGSSFTCSDYWLQLGIQDQDTSERVNLKV